MGPHVESNSISSKIEKKPLDKEAYKKQLLEKYGSKTKDSKDSKFWKSMISDEAGKTKEYLLYDVIVPSIKRLLSEGTNAVVNMILYGDAKKQPYVQPTNTWGNQVNYSNYYVSSRPVAPQRVSANGFEPIVKHSESEIISIKNGMEQLIKRYGVATVNDLCDFARVSAPYTSQKFGWFDTDNWSICQLRDGRYQLVTSQCVPIE